jgi:hypothetical protein
MPIKFTSGKFPMQRSLFVVLFFLVFALTGCQIIGDIFKAGVWVGVILVIAVIGIVAWLFSRGSR